MNGTISVWDQFKEAFGIGHGRAFVYGTTHADAHIFFRHVADEHYKKSKTAVKFMFKRCGGNKQWNVAMTYLRGKLTHMTTPLCQFFEKKKNELVSRYILESSKLSMHDPMRGYYRCILGAHAIRCKICDQPPSADRPGY